MNPYFKGNDAYKKAAVNTEDQGVLIIMLYDGSIRFLKSAIIRIEKNDLEKAHEYIVKTKNIISELMTSLTLKSGGKVAKDLHSLYSYMFNRLIDANIQKNRKYLQEVCGLLEELRDGWRAAVDHKKGKHPGIKYNNRSEVRPIKIRG